MNRKLIIGSVLAVFMIIAVSYTSAIDTNIVKNTGDFSEQEVDKQQNPSAETKLSDSAPQPPTAGRIRGHFIIRPGNYGSEGRRIFVRRNVWISPDDGFLTQLSIGFFYNIKYEDVELTIDRFYGLMGAYIYNAKFVNLHIIGFGLGITLTYNN